MTAVDAVTPLAALAAAPGSDTSADARQAAAPAGGAYATPPGFARETFRAMGTAVTVVLPEADRVAAVAVEELFASWETALSRFRPDSELSRLNAAAGRAVPASGLMLRVVEAALRAARSTDGVFDPTLEPALRAAGYDRTFEEVAVDGPAARVPVPGGAWRHVEVDRAAGTVRLPAGAGLDLGGIAKGMAVDAAVAELARAGVAAAAVEAGGDVAVHGLPPGLAAWPVGVEVRRWIREVAVTAGGLATSGIGRRTWVRGGRVRHHILDPRTGDSAATDLWSVTAAAATCAQAEVAAKVAVILGETGARRFLLRIGVSALLVRCDGGEVLVGSWGDATGGMA